MQRQLSSSLHVALANLDFLSRRCITRKLQRLNSRLARRNLGQTAAALQVDAEPNFSKVFADQSELVEARLNLPTYQCIVNSSANEERNSQRLAVVNRTGVCSTE